MLSKLKNFNVVMFLPMLALIAIGTVFIWSAGNARTEVVFHSMWINNLVTAIFGLIIYFIIAFTDYHKIIELAATPMYVAALFLLIAVLIIGDEVFGGKRWLWFFQPSEISKLCIITFMSAMLPMLEGFKGFLIAMAFVAFPCLLILLEPDLGTTLTLVPAVLLMFFAANLWRKGMAILLAVGFVVAIILLGAVYQAEKPGTSAETRAQILKYVPLKNHQIKRIRVFLFPDDDLLGAGYNLRQAKISIGSGGLTGKGIAKGESNHLKYLPQSISMNDFIFCVYAEETGYVGSLILLTLFGLLIIPGAVIALAAGDIEGRLLSLGVSMLIFAHIFINIAMSIGLVPITGLPLPFISSGRTFLVTIMAGLGLVQSVSIHKGLTS